MSDDGISVAWEGLKGLYDALHDRVQEADAAAKLIVSKSAAVVIAASKKQFAGAHAKGKPHEGGDQPNVVTGYLRRSIIAEGITRAGFGEYSTRVGPTAIYGRAVELGLRNGAKYPYFEPAVREVQPALQAIADEEWAKVAR